MKDETEKPTVPPPSEAFEDPGLRRAALAAEAGDLAQLRVMKDVDLDTIERSGISLLVYEITAGNELAVRTLLAAGANPNVLAPSGTSAMFAAGVTPDSKFLRLLLDNGGDPNLEDQRKEPLLTRLVYFDQWDNLLLLLDRGAQIDAVGPSGQTAALMFGSLHQFDHVYALLERGADPTIQDVNGLQLSNFVNQRVAPDSPQASWQKKVAERIGL
ncbi:MAG TPA: hypothetical protein PK156_22415 [Polyangium sp.]|nr:hypothetical protein [Polyangium sp.]